MCYSLIISSKIDENSIVVLDTFETIPLLKKHYISPIKLYITFKLLKDIEVIPGEDPPEISLFFPFLTHWKAIGIVNKPKSVRKEISRYLRLIIQNNYEPDPQYSFVFNLNPRIFQKLYGVVDNNRAFAKYLEDTQKTNPKDKLDQYNDEIIIDVLKEKYNDNLVKIKFTKTIKANEIFTIELYSIESHAIHSWLRHEQAWASFYDYPSPQPPFKANVLKMNQNGSTYDSTETIEYKETEVIDVFMVFLRFYYNEAIEFIPTNAKFEHMYWGKGHYKLPKVTMYEFKLLTIKMKSQKWKTMNFDRTATAVFCNLKDNIFAPLIMKWENKTTKRWLWTLKFGAYIAGIFALSFAIFEIIFPMFP